nr:hypothetical protein [Kibdelosporangium sp. MJ126-NF4]CTQ88723.1 hypothetical protein [Kibdelosporangium sp. MJ126-NF4]
MPCRGTSVLRSVRGSDQTGDFTSSAPRGHGGAGCEVWGVGKKKGVALNQPGGYRERDTDETVSPQTVLVHSPAITCLSKFSQGPC